MKYVRRRFKQHEKRPISLMPHTIQVFGDDRKQFFCFAGMLSDDVRNWFYENIGEYLIEWAYSVTYKDKLVFYFTSKDKAFAFKLRWA